MYSSDSPNYFRLGKHKVSSPRCIDKRFICSSIFSLCDLGSSTFSLLSKESGSLRSVH